MARHGGTDIGRQAITARPSPSGLQVTASGRRSEWDGLHRIGRFEAAKLLTKDQAKVKVVPEINRPFQERKTRLHYFAMRYDKESIRELLTMGADANAKDMYDQTPLHAALRFGRKKEDIELLANKTGEIDISSASNMGDLKRVTELLTQNPQLARATVPWSPLHGAARIGNIEIARLLLKNGANINLCEIAALGQTTPLGAATRTHQAAMVKFLIDNGADVNQQAGWGLTPLALAKYYNQKDIEKMLKDRGAQERLARTPAEKRNPEENIFFDADVFGIFLHDKVVCDGDGTFLLDGKKPEDAVRRPGFRH